MDEEIKSETALVLARRAPAAGDLRAVLSAMAMSTNLERCGDYAKNIAKRTTVLAETVPDGDTMSALRRIARVVEMALLQNYRGEGFSSRIHAVIRVA